MGITKHAQDRMSQRHIKHWEVERTFNKGSKVSSNDNDTTKYNYRGVTVVVDKNTAVTCWRD